MLLYKNFMSRWKFPKTVFEGFAAGWREHGLVRLRTRDGYPKAASTIADRLQRIIERRCGYRCRLQQRRSLRGRGRQIAPHPHTAAPACRCTIPSLISHCNPNVICVWHSPPCFITAPSFPRPLSYPTPTLSEPTITSLNPNMRHQRKPQSIPQIHPNAATITMKSTSQTHNTSFSWDAAPHEKIPLTIQKRNHIHYQRHRVYFSTCSWS